MHLRCNFIIQDSLFSFNISSVDYIVLTSVDRDDLPDGGSGQFAQTVKAMKVCKSFWLLSQGGFYSVLLCMPLQMRLKSEVGFVGYYITPFAETQA